VSFRWRKGIALSAGAALGILALAGCEGFGTTQDIGFYTVRAERTRVFLFAPGHTSEGDVTLTQGQRLVMLRQEFGYSHVMTADGQKGYVATNDIAPERGPVSAAAPVSRTPPPATPSRTSRGSGAPYVSSANRSVIQSGALFESGLLPLPQDPEIAEAGRGGKSRPGFRVSVPVRNAPTPESRPKGRFRISVPGRGTATPEAKPKGE
jgi:hypothetical protein